jgi:hypothetical protein
MTLIGCATLRPKASMHLGNQNSERSPSQRCAHLTPGQRHEAVAKLPASDSVLRPLAPGAASASLKPTVEFQVPVSL